MGCARAVLEAVLGMCLESVLSVLGECWDVFLIVHVVVIRGGFECVLSVLGRAWTSREWQKM